MKIFKKNKKHLLIFSLAILFFVFNSKSRAASEDNDTVEIKFEKAFCKCAGSSADPNCAAVGAIGYQPDKYCAPFANSCRTGSGTMQDKLNCINQFYNKSIDRQKDELIAASNLDSQTASDLTQPCGSDLACINSVLNNLKSDPNFGDNILSTSTSADGPLTLSDAQSLINSSQNQSNGVSNSADNIGPAGQAALSKQQGPQVSVTFSSNGTITNGAKITARAVPGFFRNSPDTSGLYFTWYIKHEGCELSDKVTDTNNFCDLDGNQKITTNDWKIAAARIIVQGDFDKIKADYSKSIDDSYSGVKAYPSVTSQWIKNFVRNDDGDLIKENDESGDIPNCYIQDPDSGTIYEERESTSDFPDHPCPNGYYPACVKTTTATCDVVGDATKNVFSACQVYNNPLIDNDGTFSNSKEAAEALYKCSVDSKEDRDNFVAETYCINGGDSICVKKDGSNCYFPDSARSPISLTNPLLGIIFAKGKIATAAENNTNGVCAVLAKPNPTPASGDPLFLDNTNVFKYPNGKNISEDCAVVTDELVNGIKDNFGKTIIEGNSELKPKCSMKRASNVCKHLFPYFPEKNVTVKIYDNKRKEFVDSSIDTTNLKAGDGHFNIDEKKFWGADPLVDSTNGLYKDEASVIGLGVDKFKWTYAEGDQIGVAIEGQSMLPSEHAEAANRIMWAFSKNSCDAINKPENKNDENRGFYVEDAKGGNSTYGIHTINFDIDKCLPENLLTPNLGEAQQFVDPSVTLNATPSNPTNDPNGRGDILKVSAGTTNMSNVYYNWHTLLSMDGATSPTESTNWVDISNDLLNNKSFTLEDLQGLDKSELSILLNIPEQLLQSRIRNFSGSNFYLKIKVDVSENNGENNESSSGEKIVKVSEQQNQILIYPVTADINGKLTLNEGSKSIPTELSSMQCDNSACYVTKNQVVGVKIPDSNGTKLTGFSWKINGNSFACTANISPTNCSNPGSNILFFPVLGNPGEAVDVVASAKNLATGALVEISKHFVIVPPTAQIVSSDNTLAWPKVLGFYRDQLGRPTIPDYSTQVMETRTGNNLILVGKFYPVSAAGQIGYEWTVDGQQIQTDPQKPNELPLPIEKVAGDSYTIGLTAKQAPDANNQAIYMRNALLRNWGVVMDDTSELNNSASIQINILDADPLASATNSTKNFAANLVTHVSEQFMFLLKIILTSTFLLLSVSLLFAFMPGAALQADDSRRY